MQAVCISSLIDLSFNESQKESLMRVGWQKINENYFTILKNNFQLTLQIKERYGVNILSCHQSTANSKYVDMPPFDVDEAWKVMWNKNTPIAEVIIYTLNNYFDNLKTLGWSDELSTEFLTHPNNSDISFHIDGNPNERFYRFVDWTKSESESYLEKLKSLNF